ncbi:MAG: malectin domain-containing carbohydrate-binding protein [Tahibacter sp.]
MRFGLLFLLGLLSAPASALTSSDFLIRTVSTDGGSGFALPYRIDVPAACASRRCPVMLFLHGAGETGTNNTAQLGNRANGAFTLAEAAATLGDPVIMVAPQAPEWWTNDGPMAGTADLLDDVQREFGFDPGRVYVTGLSMGGGGTIGFVQRFDAVAAAAIPVCPAAVISSTIDRDRLWTVPFWFFHAANDGTVTPDNSRTSVSTLRAGGGDPLFTEYASGDHFIWTQTYAIARLAPWMLAQRWRMPMQATGPRVELSAPSALAHWYTNAATLSIAGAVTPADALPGVVDYSFAALNGTATGTTSFSAGPLAIPAGATSVLRVQATGTSYVASLGGNSTFSRSVRVTNPIVANRVPKIALWAEPVAQLGRPQRLRALVDDDDQPQAIPTLSYQVLESPSAPSIQVDAADPALASWTPTQPGLYRFQLSANDGSGAVTTQSSVLVLGAGAPHPVVTAVNVGGGAFTGADGTAFNADAGFTGGTAETLTGVTTIYATQDDVLYQTTRHGNSFSYAVAVPNGRYLITLHFAEWRWFTAVARGIDVQLEGIAALTGFDLYRWAGLRQALRVGFVTTVNDGVLNIALQKSAGASGEAVLSGFEILALGATDLIMRDGFQL